MTNKQRVWAAIRGEACPIPASQIDLTPAAEEKIASALNISQENLFDFFGNCIRYANSLGNIEEYFNDHIPMDSRHGKSIEKGWARFDAERGFVFDVFGVGWNYRSEGVNTEVHPLADLSDYSTYRWPDAHPGMLDFAKQTVEQHGDQDFIMGFQHIGLFERSWAIRGYENFLCDLMTEPEFCEEMLDHILRYKLQEAAYYVDIGVDAVRIGDDWGLQNSLQMRPTIWRRFFKPRYEKLYAFYRSHNMPVVQHSCGAVLDIVPDLMEIGLDVLHPIQPLSIDIRALYRVADDRLTLWGGVDTQQLLPFGTEDEVYKSAKETSALLGRNHRYIFAPAQEIMSDVPVVNVLALTRAAGKDR